MENWGGFSWSILNEGSIYTSGGPRLETPLGLVNVSKQERKKLEDRCVFFSS